MWVSTEFSSSFVLALVSAFCWGTWSNAAKAAATVRGHAFPLFYLDFSVSVFATAVVIFISPLGNFDFFHDLPTGWQPHVLAALGGGAVFNVANILLVNGIGMVGLAVAFPVGVGTALVLGTVLTFAIDGRGDAAFLFGGVLTACVAIALMVTADGQKMRDQAALRADAATDEAPAALEDDREALTAARGGDGPLSRRKGLVVCAVSGLLMSLFNPLLASSMHQEADGHCSGCLTPYGSTLLFTLAVLLTSPLICKVLLTYPLIGPAGSLDDYWQMPLGYHTWGLLGGLLWEVGSCSNVLSGDALGFALSYAIGQSAPMVATSWGLLWYKEFEGVSAKTHLLIGAMFIAYISAIALVAMSK